MKFIRKSIICIQLLLVLSCSNKKDQYPGFRKLSAKELVDRAKENNWPDINKVVYILNNDTITIDSVQKLNYHEIAFDDYVNSEDQVALAVVRPATTADLEIRKRMNEVSESDNLNGQLRTLSVVGSNSKEERRVTVYTPNSFNKSNIYIYMTDGAFAEGIMRSVNRLINNNEIIPINIIGVHSDPENRFREYVLNDNYQDVFNNHLNLFLEEVPKKVETEIIDTTVERYLFGYSNGADFCNFIGIHYPTWAKTILAMSGVAYFPKQINDLTLEEQLPEFVLSSGIEEELNFKNEYLAKQLKKLGAKVIYTEHTGGHEYKIWEERFIDFVLEKFNTCK